ncbi:14 kDa phosphohistidine phosphatase-like [Anneissia japonica]|uniref:14 kDa phosphohistidine phosphatase-like n=1 Tax=Anneissia japonica TaxID=1529436 RepID=UPI00142597F1|nr:14 kDa phosphohistidine phosphatase-like [Anneissia japonica]XP_033119528.1 14 kDa phosphohistidine phosphatase-like [Anneissia japonica]
MAVKEGDLDCVTDVDIDSDGIFKYILIKIKGEGCSKYIVRGHAWAEYHADIYEREEKSLGRIKSECVGGGRIKHDSKNKHIVVYGYSVGFGKADHAITVGLLKKKYPDYDSITWNNEGY